MAATRKWFSSFALAAACTNPESRLTQFGPVFFARPDEKLFVVTGSLHSKSLICGSSYSLVGNLRRIKIQIEIGCEF